MMRVLVIFRELAVFPTMPNLVSVENDATLAKSGTWKKEFHWQSYGTELVVNLVF